MNRIVYCLTAVAFLVGCDVEQDSPAKTGTAERVAEENAPRVEEPVVAETRVTTNEAAQPLGPPPAVLPKTPEMPRLTNHAPPNLSDAVYKGAGGIAVPDSPASLMAFDECDGATEVLRARAIKSMEAALDTAMVGATCAYSVKSILGDSPDCDLFSQGGVVYLMGSGEDTALPDAPAAEDYSETNNQVADVDEADFIKNDGNTIYMVANGKLHIIQAWPPESISHLSEIELEGEPGKLFVHGDQAIVFSAGDHLVADLVPDFECAWYQAMYPSQECTYGYDCDFTGDGRKLIAQVYDISDKTQPVLTRKLQLDGSYINARRIGEAVFIVVSFPPAELPGLKYQPAGLEELMDGQGYEGLLSCVDGQVPQSVIDAYAQLKELNKETINLASDAELWPTATDFVVENGVVKPTKIPLSDCASLLVSPVEQHGSLLAVIGLDITDSAPPTRTVIMGKPGAVYASAESLYVAVRQYAGSSQWWPFSQIADSQATVIHKFGLSPEHATAWYAATGAVKGRVLNQFSLDEHEGYFRVATSTGLAGQEGTHSTVSVLEQQGTTMDLVGQVDGLAPNEDIRSARFVDDTAYVVTFEKTDPLFVLDLSEPYNPVVKGELKIPGFSTYMHVLDDDHLLSIGYDADDQGQFSWFEGIMLQVFDVSDMADPQLIHKEVIGTRGSTSDATTNHLAFNYFGAKQRLGLPMVVCEDGYGGTYGDQMTFSGLMVYKVTPEDGFEYLGGIENAMPDEMAFGCYNWWTKSNSKVKRSVFMDDYVFSVALDEIKVAHVDDLADTVGAVSLE